MALLSGWTSADLQDEITEFINRSNTRYDSSFWVKSEWADAYEDVLNKAITGGVSEASEMDNRCSARSASGSVTNITDSSAQVNATIYGHDDDAFGNLEYRVAYDTDSNFGSPSYSATGTLSVYSITGGNSVNRSLSGLADNTTYYWRFEVRNPWQDNWNTGQRNQIASGNFTTDEAAACADPTGFTAQEQPFGSVQLDWSSTYNPVNGWEIQYRVNNGNWNVLVDNLTGSNRSYVHNGCSGDYSNGNSVDYRIKAQCSGVDSNWVEASAGTIANCK